jgi:hypothetical protein
MTKLLTLGTVTPPQAASRQAALPLAYVVIE